MRLSHLALFLLLPGQALAADIFVSNSIELEDAFEWANSGDVIWVAAGLYNNIDATNVADSVTIERETVGDVVQMELGKVNADGLTFRGIDFIDNDIEVQRGNFTYPDTNDSPVTFDDCTFDNIRSGNTVGGAMDVRDGGWVVIRNSTFTSNFANEGGAIGTWRNTRIEVYDSVFTGNTSNNGGGAIHGRDRYDLVVEGSVFSNNQSDDSGGAIQFEFGPASIRSSVFDHNWSRDNGGAISVRNAESFVLEDCTFEDNYVDSGLSTYGAAVDIQSTPAAEVRRNQFCNNGLTREPDKGGALALRSGDGEVTNNIFVGNRSERSGAGVYVENGSANIHNNTFVANEETQPQWGVAANFWSGNGDFRNNIVAHHLQVPAFDGSGSTVAYNLWWQNLGGDSTNSLDATNVFADPDFVGWSNDNLCGDDLHLMWGSAAIGTGDPAILNPDGSRSDIGAFGGPAADPTDWVDGDTDGSPVQYDCDDADPLNAPGFPEECDNQDNDCDGLVDDNDPDAVLVAWYPDTDFDGYGDDLGTARMACFANSAESDILGDCDDSTAAVSPDATEVCDGIDNNCDGSEDEGFADTDGDTIVDCLDTEDCDGVDNDGNGLVDEGYDDTDDDNIADCVDTETCDGIDNDGDGDIDELWTDTTGDGVIDCPTTEICDGIDNDQNGTIDDNFPDSDTDGVADCVDTEECDGIDNDGDGVPDNGFADNDGDGIGNCVDTEDCDGIDNDGNGSIDENFPDNDTDGIANCVDVEECDGVDNNGDGTIDEGFDNDNDGIANCFDTETCDEIDNDGDGDVDEGLDSDNDGLKDCHVDEVEECDGIDNDGDGLVDDQDDSLSEATALDWYSDQDSDGFGDPAGLVYACLPPAGYVGNDADCEPDDSRDFPGAVERCDLLDNDCDASIDENTVVGTFWLDSDGDSYGDPDETINDCTPPDGYVANGADCDDSAASVNPGASDVCGDGIDADCDGVGADTSDEDGDGIRADLENAHGSSDCNPDMDFDGIPDGVEWGLSAVPRDSDNDLIPDIFDEDDDDDGISTFDEGDGDNDGAPIVACDGEAQGCTVAPDGIPNYLDLDSDGDCIPDAQESAFNDADDDGVVDFVDCNDGDGCLGDSDGDTLTNCEEDTLGTSPTNADTDGDGVPDDVEVGSVSNPTDTDGDEVINALDPDDDGDLVPTVIEDLDEDGDPTNDHTDDDGIPDYLDDDDDGDGVLTADEDLNGDGDPTNDHADDDGIPEYLDNTVADSDGDGIDDPTELQLGTDPDNADSDGDGIDDLTEVGDVDDPTNSDGDLLIDALDADDDADGIDTLVEGDGDTDGDSVPDYLDDDSDGDGILDATEGDEDVDGDGVPNFQDTDADGDNVPDSVEGEGDDDDDGIPNYLDAGGGGVVNPPPPEEEGCGCATGAPGSSWMAIPLLIGLLRRRAA